MNIYEYWILLLLLWPVATAIGLLLWLVVVILNAVTPKDGRMKWGNKFMYKIGA